MYTILLVLMFLCLIVDAGLVLFTVTRLDRKRTACFTVLCSYLCIYALGYLVELLAQTSSEAYLALIIENFAIPSIAPFFFLTSIALFAPARYRSWHMGIAALFGMFIFAIVLTNPYHNLYYTSIEMIRKDTGYFALIGRGPLYLINQASIATSMIIAYSVLLRRFLKGSKKLRRQMSFFVIGSLISFVANILNFSGLLPTGLDPTPIALTLGLLCFSISLIRDDLMDVVVKARDSALESMADSFIVLDDDGDFLYCNQSAMSLFPGLREYQGTESVYDLKDWPAELNQIKTGNIINFSLAAKESIKHYRATIRTIRGWAKKSMGISVIIRDTTEETNMIEQLDSMASHDSLTGILNRRRLFEMVGRELEIAKRVGYQTALIMYDLDHFKLVNDQYGHHVGDQVLQEMTAEIEKKLRCYDIFGRIGGEEFVIFSRDPGQEGLTGFAERLRQIVEAMHIESDRGTVRLTASFGVSRIPPGGNLKDALKQADKALYEAKNSGRNKVVFAEYVESAKNHEEIISSDEDYDYRR